MWGPSLAPQVPPKPGRNHGVDFWFKFPFSHFSKPGLDVLQDVSSNGHPWPGKLVGQHAFTLMQTISCWPQSSRNHHGHARHNQCHPREWASSGSALWQQCWQRGSHRRAIQPGSYLLRRGRPLGVFFGSPRQSKFAHPAKKKVVDTWLLVFNTKEPDSNNLLACFSLDCISDGFPGITPIYWYVEVPGLREVKVFGCLLWTMHICNCSRYMSSPVMSFRMMGCLIIFSSLAMQSMWHPQLEPFPPTLEFSVPGWSKPLFPQGAPEVLNHHLSNVVEIGVGLNLQDVHLSWHTGHKPQYLLL